MLAYKFRGEDQIPFALDIILNQRLFCPSPSMLNDPLEGFFRTAIVGMDMDRAAQAHHEVIQEQSYLSVCSLTRTWKFIPLWAYYASGFSGLAIEVEIPTDASEVQKVNYTKHLSLGTLPQCDPKRAARESLCMKLEQWEHEEEVRIIRDSRDQPEADKVYYPCTVRRIIVGLRMKLALLETFKIVSKSQGIELCQAHLSHNPITSLNVVKIPI